MSVRISFKLLMFQSRLPLKLHPFMLTLIFLLLLSYLFTSFVYFLNRLNFIFFFLVI